MNAKTLTLLIAVAVLGLSACGSSKPLAQQVEWDSYDHTLTFPDGSTLAIDVNGRIPPVCDYSLPVTAQSDCVDIPAKGCDFATFRIEEDDGLSTAMSARGGKTDPAKTELTLNVAMEDCPSLPSP
jgi:hypothetical protein